MKKLEVMIIEETPMSSVYNKISDFKTTSPSNLTTHKGKKYNCNQCEYQATTPAFLKQHEASYHDGVKYTCNSCFYPAKRPSNMWAHTISKHAVKKYDCKVQTM